MSVKIVIDSAVDVSQAHENEFIIVPLTVRFGNDEYLDRVELDSEEFYQKLAESKTMPSTSQVNISSFEGFFEAITANGDDAVVITLSSKLSGTYHSACVAADEYKNRIFVVDSRNVSLGAGVLAELALKMANDGLNAWDIARRLTVERDNIKVVAVFDTLEYLKRGGRLSSATAFAGTVLALKPIITVKNGEIAVIGKARGAHRMHSSLFKEIEECGGINHLKPCLFGYTGLDGAYLYDFIKEGESLWEGVAKPLDITVVGSSVGAHAGPGAIAVAFFINK